MKDFRINNCQENDAQTTEAVTDDQARVARLVGKAVGGDFEAFGKLYSTYVVQIYRYVFYQVKNKMIAEDLTEEVFVKAWKSIGSCKGKENTFSSWLFRIARNHIIDNFRRGRKDLPVEVENMARYSDPKVRVEATLESQELLEVITDLPQKQREVIILKFIDGLDNREISKVLGKGEGAIRVLQMRALALLREKLGRQY